MRTDEEERMVLVGDEASELLNHSAFNNVLNRMVESLFQNFVNSKPDEEAQRTHIYNHYRSLVDVTNTLKQQVAVRDQIIQGDISQEDQDHEQRPN